MLKWQNQFQYSVVQKANIHTGIFGSESFSTYFRIWNDVPIVMYSNKVGKFPCICFLRQYTCRCVEQSNVEFSILLLYCFFFVKINLSNHLWLWLEFTLVYIIVSSNLLHSVSRMKNKGDYVNLCSWLFYSYVKSPKDMQTTLLEVMTVIP